MLETSLERVKLLKSGISGEKLEELYIIRNNFKIVRFPMNCKLVEIQNNQNCKTEPGKFEITERSFPRCD